MFEKALTDVVKGIRPSKRETALYILQCISEIKSEINSSDMFVKTNALQKLTFLQMKSLIRTTPLAISSGATKTMRRAPV